MTLTGSRKVELEGVAPGHFLSTCLRDLGLVGVLLELDFNTWGAAGPAGRVAGLQASSSSSCRPRPLSDPRKLLGPLKLINQESKETFFRVRKLMFQPLRDKLQN